MPLFEQPGSRASWGIDGPVSGIVHERPTNIPAVVLVPWIITDVCMYVCMYFSWLVPFWVLSPLQMAFINSIDLFK